MAAVLRRLRSRLGNDHGSAALEFITAGVLLLVPVVYLILTLSAVQTASLAAEGAARHAARVFVLSEEPLVASAGAHRAVELTLDDYGVDASTARTAITCAPDPGECLERRSRVTVQVRASVPLPLLPPVLGIDAPVSIPIEATATQSVSRFWGTR